MSSLEDQLEELRMDLEAHMQDFAVRIDTENKRFESLMLAQENNTKAIASLIEETRDIIKFSRDVQGAARLSSGAQKLLIALGKWGAVILGSLAVIKVGWMYILDLSLPLG